MYLRRILKVYDELSKSGIEEKDIITPAYWNKRIDDKNRIYKNASVFVSASMDALSATRGIREINIEKIMNEINSGKKRQADPDG